MTTATVEHTKPLRRFGKTALMLHGLGVLFLLAGTGALAALGVEKNENYTFLGFGGAAFGVLTLWAIWLLVRSYHSREQSGFAFGLVLLFLFEYTTTFLLLKVYNYEKWSIWHGCRGACDVIDANFDYCIPAIVAFLLFVLSAGVPLARWLTRRVEVPQRPARQRQWLKRIAVVALPTVFLPMLIAYSIITLPLPFVVSRKDRFSVWVAQQAPHLVSDAVEEAARSSRLPYFEYVQCDLLKYGCASKERLVLRFSQGVGYEFNSAWAGLEKFFPDQLLIEAIRKGKEKGSAVTSGYRIYTGLIAERASPQKIREILDAGTEFRVEFRRYLLASLAAKYRSADYSLDLLRLAAEEETCRRNTAASFADIQEFNAAWDTLFTRKNWSARCGLAYTIPYLEHPLNAQLKFFEQCLNDPDMKMRRAAMASACLTKDTFHWSSADPDERKVWIAALLKYVDDPDVFIRRSAVHILAVFTDVRIGVTPDESALIEKANWSAAAPVAGEDQERDTVRTAAQHWLVSR